MRRSTTIPRLGGAFTLVEMLVVVLIVGMLAGLSLAIVPAMLREGAVANIANQVSAQLSAARAIAMRDGRDTAVIFVGRDISADFTEGEILMHLGIRNDDPSDVGFKRYGDRTGDVLRERIFVRGPNFAGGVDDAWLIPANDTNAVGSYLIVWFGPDGSVRFSDPARPAATVYFDDNGNNGQGGVSEKPCVPVPFLAIYNQADFDIDSGGATIHAWINDAGPDVRLLVFNRYSGALMRRPGE